MGVLKGMIVLVTGSGGFIGRHMVKRLVAEEAAVWTLSRSHNSETNLVIKEVVSDLNLLDKEIWARYGQPHFDIVFHLAAFIPKSKDEANDVRRVFEDNIIGTRRLLGSLFPLPKRIIFASSIDVYALLAKGETLTESSPVKPSTLYASSKLFCEDLIKLWAKKNGISFVILRYGHVYGPGEDSYKKLIPQTIRSLLAEDSPSIHGDGTTERDLIYVDDVVEATLRAALLNLQELGPINIVKGESVSVRTVVEILMRLKNSSAQIRYLPDKTEGKTLRFSNELMHTLLGKWSRVSLEDGLKCELENMHKMESK